MWILESNGDFLQGKRMWLKPGQKYLFGRVKREGVRFAIDHKTVSRKHFIILVDPVKPGDVAQVRARTRIRIEDQNSKSGTSVNGELIKGSARELKGEENSIRPGTCPHEIVIRWQPCVLTFNLLKKEVKSGVLKTKQARVEALDIKATSDFVSEYTTHLVANKRNTAKGLQALISGRHLVAESYIDAIEYAATPTNLSQEENLSPLELDFDTAWPNPDEHLPPPGKEPTARPVESYRPDSSRVNIFSGYTFVFGDEPQYDNLLPVVTSGHGKALLFKVVNDESTSDDLLQFLRNASGTKTNGHAQIEDGGGVVLVRWTGKEDVQEWTNNLVNEVALKMDQRAIDQSEFLDAILAGDATLLKQTIPFESTTDGRMAPPPSAANSLVAKPADESGSIPPLRSQKSVNRETNPRLPASSRNSSTGEADPPEDISQVAADAIADEEVAPRPLRRARFTQTNKFKTFDDGFDPDSVAEYQEDEDEDVQDIYPSDSEALLQGATQLSAIKEESGSTSKKRPHSPSEIPENDFADEMDDLLPAATAYKKRKLAEAQVNGRPAIAESVDPFAVSVKKKKKEREIDVRKLLGLQREEKEEAARRRQAYLLQGGGIEDKYPAHLVEIVTMELPVRDKTKRHQGSSGEGGQEWDPKWNGRKNFKGFRRAGEAPQRRGHASKVFVPLVEIRRQKFGIGEQYWDKPEEEKARARERKRREEAKSQRTQSQTQEGSGASRHSRSRANNDSEEEEVIDEALEVHDVQSTSPGATRLQREAAEIVEHEIDPDTPRRTRAADRQAAGQAEDGDGQDATQGLALSQGMSAKAKGKRAATTSATSAPKRQKTLPVTVTRGSDSEDDSDDMKFKFGSRARRGRGKAAG